MCNEHFHFLAFLLVRLLWIILVQSQHCTAVDTLTPSQTISVEETLVSAKQIFELGFFSPGNSSNKYVGIWYKNIPLRRALWVANREKPIKGGDTASSLTIGGDGNLRLLDGNQNIIWSTNVSGTTNHSVVVLRDDGNLVLQNNVSRESLWESFHHPCDTVLPGMMIGLNTRTHQKRFLTSWKTENDPSPGMFVFGVSSASHPQTFTWKDSVPYHRSGEWNGQKFIGMRVTPGAYRDGFNYVENLDSDNHYLTLKLSNSSDVRIITLTSTGDIRCVRWDEVSKEWTNVHSLMESPCDIYGTCGAFGICNKTALPICRCLDGFVPKSEMEWSKGNWTSGCMRQTQLNCPHNNTSNLSSGTGETDGFRKVQSVQLPDLSIVVPPEDVRECKSWCLKNCTCQAYAFVGGIGCLQWTGDLLDIQEFSPGAQDLFLRLAKSEIGKGKEKEKLILILALSCPSFIVIGVILYLLHNWRGKRREKMEELSKGFRLRATLRHQDPAEFPEFDYDTILAATNKFCSENILGKGGFGPIYKGRLEDGQEIAVKKLSTGSGQGIEEFKNEIVLISKLQHRNLVRLFGFCVKAEELMIVYEYMPNRSLDFFLFDDARRRLLDWASRFNIIQGIAGGLLYLHRDSRLKIIHRDLEVSNILLDKDMNPKISDFGLARVFLGTEEFANTQRVVGTYGYMSPEYALGGMFSEKSDTFSFGVLLLEIVSGIKGASFHLNEEYLSFLGYAWEEWTSNRALDFMDESLADSCIPSEVMRCIHAGLLCVQDQAADRPTMPTVVRMLTCDADAPQPKQPTFTFQRMGPHVQSQSTKMGSNNELTITKMEGR